jgi:hypothetical protein
MLLSFDQPVELGVISQEQTHRLNERVEQLAHPGDTA